jgi:flagellar basal-body rod modification protein FlgD
MAEVQNLVNPLATLAARAGSDAPKSPVVETQERFLKLLVTQMRNQDPLNPLDNAQVTTQLAQLNTVTGISQLNETLQGLAASFAAAQVLQAAPLVGHDVMVPGSQLTLAGGRATFGAQLAQPVDSLTVDILDAAGHLVHRAEAGPQQAGIVGLGWDGAADGGGTAPDGQYRFVLKALAGGKAVDATALAVARVLGVSAQGAGIGINLSTGASSKLADVRQIF